MVSLFDGNNDELLVCSAHNFCTVFLSTQVGTGFSFTDKDEGYARNEVDVARDLYRFV